MVVRNVVFGDTGGWLPQLLRSLSAIGVDLEASTIPEGVRIFHVGDLLHKGPFSKELLRLVAALQVRNPGQWIQLLGNHELQHFPGSPYFWSCSCDQEDVNLLGALWQEGLAKVSHGLALPEGTLTLRSGGAPEGAPEVTVATSGILFCHGGLTEGFWRWHTGGEEDPVAVSELLNTISIPEVTAAGEMLGEVRAPGQVGPVWAVGNSEVWPDWESSGSAMPFTQIHGHTSSYSFGQRRWFDRDLPAGFKEATTLLPEGHAVATELAGNLLVGVDPGFSVRVPTIERQPWVEFTSES